MKLCLFTRPVIRPLLALLLAPCAFGQQICSENAQLTCTATKADVTGVTVAQDKADTHTGDTQGVQQFRESIPTEAELPRRIALYEAAARKAEYDHASDGSVAKLNSFLAILYDDAGMYGQSEAAFEHAISLLRRDPKLSEQLAEDINGLGSLHALMGKRRQAEKEELEALKLRQNLGGSLEIARSWNSLAQLYLRESKYATAGDFAQRALDEFSVSTHATAADRILSRFNVSMALCFTKACPSAIPLLKDAIDLAKTTYRPNDSSMGIGDFLLGYAYWKAGDQSGAAEYMKQGTAIMKEQLGWGHPTYLNAMSAYARFLRERQRVEDAEAVEREIRMAEAVVDVHSIQTPKGALSLAGLR
jgi:tetratricopeptide (TPR) repeat protein